MMSMYQMEVHVSDPYTERSDLRDIVVVVTDGKGNEWRLQGPVLGGDAFVAQGFNNLTFTCGKQG